MNIIYCDDSMEGIFTAIYESYEWKLDYRETRVELQRGNYELFAAYYESVPNLEKTKKVERTLLREFGTRFYEDIGFALASTDEEKAQAVYQTIALGLTLQEKGKVLEYLTNPWVLKVNQLSLQVAREEDHMKGFLRFEELSNGVLYSKIGPKNHVIGYLAQHFKDRLPQENFIIYDETRELFVVHPKGQDWYFMSDNGTFREEDLEYSSEEKKYQELFCTFCSQIAIKERQNLTLQRNMLPLRFRTYMTEFNFEQVYR